MNNLCDSNRILSTAVYESLCGERLATGQVTRVGGC